MVSDTSTPLQFQGCPHRHVTTVTSGGMHFSEGEVWDDIEEHLLCLDCMEYLTEAEIRLGWSGKPHEVPTNAAEEETDVPY